MQVLVATEGHFQSLGVEVFHHNLSYERFWKRYLQVYDSVLVVSRVKPVDRIAPGWGKATGQGVEFCALPDYHGPWQYWRERRRIISGIREAIGRSNTFILRVPGMVGTLVWKNLPKGQDFAIEVVADPWDSLSPGSIKSLGRPFFRLQWARNLKKQCQQAAAAAYVTEYSLQKRYPPGGWATYYSDVELSDDAIVDQSALAARFERVKAKAESDHPWRLCYVGSMSRLYKAPDVLIEAVAQCIKGGMTLELTMVGDGQLRPQLEKQAKTSGIADYVQFPGMALAGKEVFDQLDKADLFVLPSRQEGLPRVMVEAMARGVPCIGSTVGGFPELLAAEDLVTPADVQALAEKIREVLSNTNKLEEMSKRNLETVNKKFRRQELNRRWVEFYKMVADICSTVSYPNCR
jgi:glycosyltransferase involved in cell wall biosynthesis